MNIKQLLKDPKVLLVLGGVILLAVTRKSRQRVGGQSSDSSSGVLPPPINDPCQEPISDFEMGRTDGPCGPEGNYDPNEGTEGS